MYEVFIECICIKNKYCIRQVFFMINPKPFFHKWINQDNWQNEPRNLGKTVGKCCTDHENPKRICYQVNIIYPMVILIFEIPMENEIIANKCTQ